MSLDRSRIRQISQRTSVAQYRHRWTVKTNVSYGEERRTLFLFWQIWREHEQKIFVQQLNSERETCSVTFCSAAILEKIQFQTNKALWKRFVMLLIPSDIDSLLSPCSCSLFNVNNECECCCRFSPMGSMELEGCGLDWSVSGAWNGAKNEFSNYCIHVASAEAQRRESTRDKQASCDRQQRVSN